MGSGVEQNFTKAIEWYKIAAEHGHAPSQFNLALCYYNGDGVDQDYTKAVEWFTKAAEQGEIAAQFNLAVCYENGDGVEQDYEKAIEWYKIAAEHGHASAQFNLALCYKHGEGVDQDYTKAVEWFTKAAEQGEIAAQFNLAVCYENGDGVEQDYEKAVECYEKYIAISDSADVTLIYNCIAIGYYEGKKTKQNYEKAFEYYLKSAQLGDVSGQNFVAFSYWQGKGTAQDNEKAFEWYQKSANQGDINGQYNIGCFYLNGVGTDKNIRKSETILKSIIDNSESTPSDVGYAAVELAQLYESEDSGKLYDLFEAMKYYRLALENGYECQSEIDALEVRLNIGKSKDNRMGIFTQELLSQHSGFEELFRAVYQKLQDEFGEVWNLLQEQSRQCIATGMISYISLMSTGEESFKNMDFSAAIVPISKACEIEFSRIFFNQFLAYLKKNHIPPEDFNPTENKFVMANTDKKSPMVQYKEDLEYLYFKQKKGRKGAKSVFYVHESKSGVYTLGGFSHYADIRKMGFQNSMYGSNGYTHESNTSTIHVNEHMLNFMDLVCKEDAFPGPNRRDQIKEYLFFFARRTNDMANKLRNPASHSSIMPYWKAVYCGNLVIMTENLLGNLMSKIKPEYLK